MSLNLSQELKGSKTAGFTLIELVITLAILGLMLNVAVPSFMQFMHENRTYAIAIDIKSNLATARAEAIKRGGNVAICGRQNDDQCTSSFNNGWIVFQDVNNDGVVDEDDSILQVNNISDSGAQLTALNEGVAIAGLRFNYRGIASVSAEFTVTLGEISRRVVLSRSGRTEMP